MKIHAQTKRGESIISALAGVGRPILLYTCGNGALVGVFASINPCRPAATVALCCITYSGKRSVRGCNDRARLEFLVVVGEL